MQSVNRAAAHMSAIVRGMLFTGFTVQILFGLLWTCRNFGHVQNFGEAESVLYGAILRLAGGIPQIMYLLQIVFAFWTVYVFLEKLRPSGRGIPGKCRAVWSVLVLLSCPFAMQCHLALLPFSLMNSLFLLMLSFVLQAVARKEPVPGESGRKEPASDKPGESGGREPASDKPGESGRKEPASDKPGEPGGREPASDKPGEPERKVSAGRRRCVPILLILAVLCGGLAAVLSGVADTANREKPGSSMEAAMASRFAWPTIWPDYSRWTEDLQEITREVAWDASLLPGNMERLDAVIEENASPEMAKSYYLQIAKTGWNVHAFMIVRQIGWDVLGYAVTPVIVQLQLRGEAYDSYTGRNYEVLSEKTPVLTRNYVDYYSWWFVVSLCLTLVSVILELLKGEKIRWRNAAAYALICLFFSAILVGILTLRGAGIMDYKYTAAVNQLWLIPALMLTGRDAQGASDSACSGEDAV